MGLGTDGRVHLIAASGFMPAQIAALDGAPLGASFGPCAAAIRETAPVATEDASCDLRWAGQNATAAASGIRGCWSHPIWQGDRVLGAVTLSSLVPGLPPPAMLRLLEEAAGIAASILRLLDLQETQRGQAARMRRLTGFNAMLAQVNQLAAARPDTVALYEGICRIAVTQARLRLAWIGTPDHSGQFHPSAAAGATGFLDGLVASADPDLPQGRGLSGTAWREGRTVVRQRFTADTMTPARWEAAQRFGLGAGAALPLMLRGVPQAVMLVYAAEEGILDADLVTLLEELAVDVGRALEAIDQQRHLGRLHVLHTALLTEADVLLHARSDTEMLQQTCEHLVEGGLFHLAWVARPDAAGIFRARASAGPSVAMVTNKRLAIDDDPPSLVARCWREGHTIVRNDVLHDPDLAGYRTLLDQGAWRSVATVPIRRGGALFAVLALGSPERGLFGPDVLMLCERIAGLLGRGLEELDLKQTLEKERRQQFHLARHDALTDVPNRRQFEEHLGEALARARRRGTQLALCLLDLDDFKVINDRFGHATGDALLRQTAQRLRGALRRSDRIARLGGDEFALAIDDFGSIEALSGLLGRLAGAIAAPFDLGGEASTVHIRLSGGVALFPADGEDFDLLLRRADAALYVTKSSKDARQFKWQRWNEESVRSTVPGPDIEDPFGPEAERLLVATEAIWPSVAAGFVETLYVDLARQHVAAQILGRLSPDEFARLKVRQTAQLVALMAPAADRDALRRAARVTGKVHALTGVDNVLMVRATGLYLSHLGRHLTTQMLRPIDRRNLISIATARIQENNAEQMDASAETVTAYFDVLLRQPPSAETRWVDAAQAQIDTLAALPGIFAVSLLRPDHEGKFHVLASGSAVQFSFAALRRNAGLTPEVESMRPTGRGLINAAWVSGELTTAANCQTDPRTAPWHDAMRALGVRSEMAVPVRDEHDRPAAVLVLLGAYPGQFETAWMRHVGAGMARELAVLWQRGQAGMSGPVVSETTAVAWRKRLFAGGLTMHYQPIIDLSTGEPRKVEALARLLLEDGQTISPGQFLPLLRARDLDELFRLGLNEALDQSALWRAEGLSLGVAINIAPSTLTQPGCVSWVRDALRRSKLAPGLLFLEITEEQSFASRNQVLPAITALAELGVTLVMDDLGSGHGDLQRLRTLPFGVVKLDQGLVRDVHTSPDRSLSFVGALVQLGHDLEMNVVVEGLETEDLVEAAAVLGATAGQGFALARPMPAAAIPQWVRSFVWTTDRNAPRTALGVLATKWRDKHSEGNSHRPAAV